jgi:hypothetical protein
MSTATSRGTAGKALALLPLLAICLMAGCAKSTGQESQLACQQADDVFADVNALFTPAKMQTSHVELGDQLAHRAAKANPKYERLAKAFDLIAAGARHRDVPTYSRGVIEAERACGRHLPPPPT